MRFDQSAQAAGLTLAEIGTVIDLREDGNVPCSHVTTLIERKLIEVRARIGDLALLETELDALIDRSLRLDPDDCTDADICHILVTPDKARAGTAASTT